MLDNQLDIHPTLKDDDLHLWEHIGTGDRLVVCFSPTGAEDPNEPQDISFPMAATGHGVNHVLFVSDPQRTWLNGPGLREKIFFHFLKFKEKVRPSSIVTLGHSMGGFYALACAADFGASAAVALAPQVSVHHEIAGDDKRWLIFWDRITNFRYKHVSELLTKEPEYFVVHGALPREKPQRDRTPLAKNITHFVLPDVHHNVPARLKREGIQETFIDTCFEGDKQGALEVLKPMEAYKRTKAKHPELEAITAPKPVFKFAADAMFSSASVSYFFVMDGRRFEAPAILLAESLRNSLGQGPDVIAYVPNKIIDDILRVTIRMMELLNVDIRGFDSDQVDWNPAYPHGNKILASCERRSTDLSVFLDTDVVCIGDLTFDTVNSNTPLFAVPEGVPTWGRNEEDWRPVYDQFGLDVPQDRVKLVKGRGRIVLPYFNAGVVGFVERGNAEGNRLPDLWLDTAKRIDANPEIEGKRPWLDQIALPVAAARMGGKIEVMENIYNFSPYRLKGEEELSHVKLLHYRMGAHYRKYEVCRLGTQRVLEKCPSRLRSRLREKLGLFLRGLALPDHLSGKS